MADQIPVDAFRRAVLLLLDEIMDKVHNFVLDEGTSMFETLASITAAEASIPVSAQSANLAAQVNHVRFYIDAVINRQENADWDGSWQVGAVTDAEWQALIDRLREATGKVRAFTETFNDWDERYMGGAIAIIAHCAYHLGEIRQGIGVIRSTRAAG
jgi:hypothetical protein